MILPIVLLMDGDVEVADGSAAAYNDGNKRRLMNLTMATKRKCDKVQRVDKPKPTAMTKLWQC